LLCICVSHLQINLNIVYPLFNHGCFIFKLKIMLNIKSILLTFFILLYSVHSFPQASNEYLNEIKFKKYYISALDKKAKYNYEGALADFEKCLSIKQDLRVYEELFSFLYKINNPAKFESLISEYIKYFPSPSLYLMRGGNRFINLMYTEGAMADFNKNIELEPNNTEGYFHRFQLKNDLHDFKGAMADLSKANDLGYYKDQSEYYEKLNFIEKSANSLSKQNELIYTFFSKIETKSVLDILTSRLDSLRIWTLYDYLGEESKTTGKEKMLKIIKNQTRRIKNYPSDLSGFVSRGFMYQMINDTINASLDFEKVILETSLQLNDTNFREITTFNTKSELYRSMGMSYFGLKKYDLAEIAFTNYLGLVKDRIHYFQRYKAYEKLKNYDKALQDLNILITAFPKFSQYYLHRTRVHLLRNDKRSAFRDFFIYLEQIAPNDTTLITKFKPYFTE
jgi:tetratricopeptide (TPR) repeat protein